MTHRDTVTIGGGPAGLAVIVSAREAGVEDVLTLGRDGALDRILNQCTYNEFGPHAFKGELTEPGYMVHYIDMVKEAGIPCKSNAIVIEINQEKEITYINREDGLMTIRVKAVILAIGCREYPKGVLSIPGYRPAGIYSAGAAWRLMNIEGLSTGKEVVILGSDDIGLIMTRRMTLEDARVEVVAELMPYPDGLKQNIVQYLDDYGILLKLSHTVIDIRGRGRATGITLTKADENWKPIPGVEEHYNCDTLLLFVDLTLENELIKAIGASMNPVISGPNVDDRLETEAGSIYTCDNVLHVYDLVDHVLEEATLTSANMAAHVTQSAAGDNAASDGLSGSGTPSTVITHNAVTSSSGHPIPVQAENGVRYTAPQTIDVERMSDKVTIRFRATDVCKGRYITVLYDGTVISKRKEEVLAPGGMEQIILKKESSADHPDLERIVIGTEME